MNLPALLIEGSVKNIRGVKDQNPYIFEFSDRYSVFDWGEMPDLLTSKGEALAQMAFMFFDILGNPQNWRDWDIDESLKNKFANSKIFFDLKQKGLLHHCHSLVDGDARSLTFGERSKYLAVRPVKIFKPQSFKNADGLQWDYSQYGARPKDALVPLEVIFRFGVPSGSSLLNRVNTLGYLEDLGLDKAPVVGDRFAIPIIEYSTKLETSDRYLSRKQAYSMAYLTEGESQKLEDLVLLLSIRLRDIFAEVGIELWDGKFELAFASSLDAAGDRDFILVDSIGPDELRILYKDIQLSKETIRKVYRDSTWYESVEKAKKLASDRGEKDWKKICREELLSSPNKLKPQDATKFSMMYKTLANCLALKFYRKNIFKDAWSLEELAQKIKGL